MEVIVQAEIPPSRKIDLFKGSISKNGEGDFKGVRQKIKTFSPFNKDREFSVIWKEETVI